MTPGPRETDAHPATAALAAALGRPPHPYAVLAYESAHLIASAAGVGSNSGEGFAQALRDARFVGARGTVCFDDGTDGPVPLCVRTVGADGDAVEQVHTPPVLDEHCALSRKNLVKQGWINPYLCA